MKICFYANIQAEIENNEIDFGVATNINLTEQDTVKIRDIFLRALLKDTGLSDEDVDDVIKDIVNDNFEKSEEE